MKYSLASGEEEGREQRLHRGFCSGLLRKESLYPAFLGQWEGRKKGGNEATWQVGCAESECGLQCGFLGVVPGLQDVGLKVLIQQLWEWWGSGVGEWG